MAARRGRASKKEKQEPQFQSELATQTVEAPKNKTVAEDGPKMYWCGMFPYLDELSKDKEVPRGAFDVPSFVDVEKKIRGMSCGFPKNSQYPEADPDHDGMLKLTERRAGKFQKFFDEEAAAIIKNVKNRVVMRDGEGLAVLDLDSETIMRNRHDVASGSHIPLGKFLYFVQAEDRTGKLPPSMYDMYKMGE